MPGWDKKTGISFSEDFYPWFVVNQEDIDPLQEYAIPALMIFNFRNKIFNIFKVANICLIYKSILSCTRDQVTILVQMTNPVF